MRRAAPRPARGRGALLRRAAACIVPAVLATAARAPLSRAQSVTPPLPRSALAVRDGGAWREWWSAARAPVRWTAPSAGLARATRWRAVRPGIDVAELSLHGSGEAWRLRVILVRLDPRRHQLALARAVRDAGLLGAWTIDSAPPDASLALNAGQFDGGTPWGWLVLDGREVQPPGTGALSMAVVVDTSGALRLIEAGAIAGARAAGGIVHAFQSYPALLVGDGEVPRALRGAGRGIDVAHRDSRLAIGTLRDGRVLVALTRFDALNGALASLPFGPTVPEMAAVMGGLGCRRAVMLDGGLSAQLLVRRGDGRASEWSGMRAVPLALVARPLAEISDRRDPRDRRR
ncbi:MAG TPA: phosphodiester glycosidase family protein [Gemmatimonadaceae bacterium]